MALTFTDRQLEVLKYVAMGKTNEEVARIMDTSYATVMHEVRKMMAATNASCRVSLYRQALEWGLIAPPEHVDPPTQAEAVRKVTAHRIGR